MDSDDSRQSDPGLSLGAGTVDAYQRSGRGKLLALGGVAVAASGLGAYLLLAPPGNRGAEDHPNRVLIVGPESVGLADWLGRQGFSAEERTFASAVSAGGDLDPTLDGLPAVYAFADNQGFGYLVVHPPTTYDFKGLGEGGDSVPEGATVAVVAVGDVAEKGGSVTFGVPSAAVEHPAPYGQQVGLLLGLFEQPRLARIVEGETHGSDLEVAADLRSKSALENLALLIKGQRGFDNLPLAWETARSTPEAPKPLIPIGGAFESLDAYPLADGGILAMTTEPGWHTDDGRRAQLADDQRRFARYIKPGDVDHAADGSLADAGQACGPVDVSDIQAMQVNGAGDAIALQRHLDLADVSAWSVQIIKQDTSLVGCPFAAVGYPLRARQMYDLGPPHPSGAMLMVSDRLRFGFKGRERSWNYPVIGPDGGASAWVDGSLVAYAGNSKYDENTRHGLAFMSALTENRFELFYPLDVLLPGADAQGLTIEHIEPISDARMLLVVGNRASEKSSVVELTFSQPMRTRLLAVDHTKNRAEEMRKVMMTSSTGVRARVVLDEVPNLDNGTFDAEGTRLAYAAAGRAMVQVLDGSDAKPTPLSPPDFGARDVRIAPSGKFAIIHREVEANKSTIRTADVVMLD